MLGILIKTKGADCYSHFNLALNEYLNYELKKVKTIDCLQNLKTLFIIDEHLNFDVWSDIKFIKELNQLKINVIVFNFERILNSFFPDNILKQSQLECINKKYQFFADLNDHFYFRGIFLNKQLLSKKFQCLLNNDQPKKDEVLFFGSINNPAYANRLNILKSLENHICIKESLRELSYSDYLNNLNEYKYILNPLGSGQFINFRFYETLFVKSIPIQQFSNKFDKYYKLEKEYCLQFYDSNDHNYIKEVISLNKKINNFNFFLEDYFYENNLSYFI